MVDYKKAVQQAKKELEKEAIEEVKKYIKETLQAIEDVKSSINVKQRELKALKADLADLEDGKLDKIKERQEKDKVAKKVSKVDVDDLGKHSPILQPFITGSDNYTHYWNGTTFTGGSTIDNKLVYTASNTAGVSGSNTSAFTLDTYKNGVAGTYVVKAGDTEKAYYIQDRSKK